MGSTAVVVEHLEDVPVVVDHVVDAGFVPVPGEGQNGRMDSLPFGPGNDSSAARVDT